MMLPRKRQRGTECRAEVPTFEIGWRTMRGEWGAFPGTLRHCGLAAWVVLAGLLTISFAQPTKALPSFARQTGQPCGTCHTDFPALTPFGRRFKLLGYTVGGGAFRTTPFPAFPTVLPGFANAND